MEEKREAEEREAIEEKREEPDRTGRDFSPDKEKSHGEILAESFPAKKAFCDHSSFSQPGNADLTGDCGSLNL